MSLNCHLLLTASSSCLLPKSRLKISGLLGLVFSQITWKDYYYSMKKKYIYTSFNIWTGAIHLDCSMTVYSQAVETGGYVLHMREVTSAISCTHLESSINTCLMECVKSLAPLPGYSPAFCSPLLPFPPHHSRRRPMVGVGVKIPESSRMGAHC